MDHHFPDSTSSSARAISAAALRLELQQEAQEDIQRASRKLSRSPGLSVAVASLALVGMLLVFHYVVRGALRQSESRQKAMALHAEAIWRCNNLQGRQVSDTCLLQVNAEARKAALLHARNTP